MTLQGGMILANRFEIRSQIGAGAFGAVYLAYDRDLSRLVAVKELSANNTELDSKEFRVQKQKFEREARALSQFQHPNVVSVYQSLHEGDADYLIFEYVAGGSLRKQLDSVHQLSIERSVALTVDICRAISAMAKYGVVHRDIKPSNILLTPDGTAKLTDFGIAQLSNASERSKAAGTRHPGTPKYMSPEQEISVGYLDERSDLYALGLVLYEMLTGQAYKAVRKPVRQMNSNVPRWLETVLDKALQQDRDKRFQSAQDLEHALLRASRPRNSPAAPRSSKRGWVAVGLIVLIAAAAAGALAIAPTISSGGITPTATVSGPAMTIKTATPTETATPTNTPTASVTPTPLPTDIPTTTPAPTSTNTLVPTRRPITIVPPTAVPTVIAATATPDCGPGKVWTVLGCKSTGGGGKSTPGHG